MSISIGIKIFKIMLREPSTEVDLIDETGASRHAISAWIKEMSNQNLIVLCGERKLGDKTVSVWKLNDALKVCWMDIKSLAK
jgi:DNA-binding transcriptional regulator GbsR (MarR family)